MTELARFEKFCALIGLKLEEFERRIMEEAFGGPREVVTLLSRGCGKTTLMAAFGLYALLGDPDAAIVCAAASREQASHLFEQARKFALRSEALHRHLVITRREIRTPTEGRMLVISADAEKQLGWDPSLVFVDELASHPDDRLYTSLRSALVKRPTSRMMVISTAGGHTDSALGELRRRALALPEVERHGAFTRARGEHLALLEWSLPEGWSIDDPATVKKAIPAPWISEAVIAEQREALREPMFRRLMCNQWVTSDEAFIGAPEWDACAGQPQIPEGSNVVVGVDASIRHDTTACVVVRRDGDVFHARWRVWVPTRGHEVPLADVEAHVRELTKRFKVEAVIYDQTYFHHAAQRLDDEGVPMVVWSHRAMAQATGTLHEAVVHGRLRHGGDPVARAHALAAEIVEREHGAIITKRKTREPNDALVALAMAVQVAASEPQKRVPLVAFA